MWKQISENDSEDIKLISKEVMSSSPEYKDLDESYFKQYAKCDKNVLFLYKNSNFGIVLGFMFNKLHNEWILAHGTPFGNFNKAEALKIMLKQLRLFLDSNNITSFTAVRNFKTPKKEVIDFHELFRKSVWELKKETTTAGTKHHWVFERDPDRKHQDEVWNG